MIALVEDGDEILLDVDARRIEVLVDDDVLAARRATMEASARPWQPGGERHRPLTSALRAYAELVTSGATGAVRSVVVFFLAVPSLTPNNSTGVCW